LTPIAIKRRRHPECPGRRPATNKVKGASSSPASSSAYGRHSPASEVRRTCKPVADFLPYGVSKYVGELYAQTFGRCLRLGKCLPGVTSTSSARARIPNSPYSGVLFSLFRRVSRLHSTGRLRRTASKTVTSPMLINGRCLPTLSLAKLPSASGRTLQRRPPGPRRFFSTRFWQIAPEKPLAKLWRQNTRPSREGDIRDSLADIPPCPRNFLGYEARRPFRRRASKTHLRPGIRLTTPRIAQTKDVVQLAAPLVRQSAWHPTLFGSFSTIPIEPPC